MKKNKMVSQKEIKKNLLKHHTVQNLQYINSVGFKLLYCSFDNRDIIEYCYYLHPNTPDLYYLFHVNRPSYGLVAIHVNSWWESNARDAYDKLMNPTKRKEKIAKLLKNEKV